MPIHSDGPYIREDEARAFTINPREIILEEATRYGATDVRTLLGLDGSELIEYLDAHGHVVRRELRPSITNRSLEEIWDPWLENSSNNSDFQAMFLGEWNVEADEQPDIRDERGGSLDEFLDEFKPQDQKERSDK